MSRDGFDEGDRVEWNTSQGRTTGRVKRKLTRSKEAAHKPGALRKIPKD